eukprot:1367842-Amorphochlora_amoeboformis.AAC.1
MITLIPAAIARNLEYTRSDCDEKKPRQTGNACECRDSLCLFGPEKYPTAIDTIHGSATRRHVFPEANESFDFRRRRPGSSCVLLLRMIRFNA